MYFVLESSADTTYRCLDIDDSAGAAHNRRELSPERPARSRQGRAEEARMADVKNERRQALDLAISQIERQFGKGAVMRLGARGPLEEIPVVPTGALSLDLALGVGGLPRGRVSEIYGPESSGKT